MLEYEVQASTLTVFCEVEHPSAEEDTRAWKSTMVTVILILPLEVTTDLVLTTS